MFEYKLYFGLTDNNGNSISKNKARIFLINNAAEYKLEITLQKALSTIDNGEEFILEKTLILTHITNVKENLLILKSIAEAYKKQFHQELVLLTETEIKRTFI